MSRFVRPDHVFDTDRFTELLELAQGNHRSQADFAKACGLTAPYLSNLKNHRLQSPPTPSTIKKIYSGAANGVTLESLLYAAGYEPAKYTAIDTTQDDRSKRQVLATITTGLMSSEFNWTKNTPDSTDYLISIDLIDEQISTWNFIFIPPKSIAEHQNELYGWVNYYFLKFMSSHGKPGTKISFITDSQQIFDTLIKNAPPYMLAMYISAILVDLSKLSIIKEQYLDTILFDEEKPNKLYTLC